MYVCLHGTDVGLLCAVIKCARCKRFHNDAVTSAEVVRGRQLSAEAVDVNAHHRYTKEET